jgi:CheY-like chemotaxis protein
MVEPGEDFSLFEIAVCDTGVGLTEDEKAVLFDRFSQPSSTHYSEYGGTGLGLHISKGLVELMGGKIFVESKKGEGSKFVFTFHGDKPVKVSNGITLRLAPEAPKSTLVVLGEAATTPKEPSRLLKHILIVEDNFINQRVITRLLESEHFTCAVASNGVEALQILQSHTNTPSPIDLIIMDIQMPVMGGIPATIEIRKSERLRGSSRIPIIGLSGNVRTSHVDNAMGAGMDAYLVKPVKKFAVLAAIERWGKLPTSSTSTLLAEER